MKKDDDISEHFYAMFLAINDEATVIKQQGVFQWLVTTKHLLGVGIRNCSDRYVKNKNNISTKIK